MKIAVVTSGGDAPGMNAAIRAVVRDAVNRGWEAFGVHHGYNGLLAGEITPIGARDVGGILQIGGTVLGSSRSPEFMTEAGRKKGLEILRQRGIDALVIIGGNGSQSGAYALYKLGYPVVGIASTIDNDLFGSDITIGVDTALNVAIEAIDRLKVTASSHQRAFAVEVMGRECGYLALMAGLAGGAEAVLIPEIDTDAESVASILSAAYDRGKPHGLVVVAEGAKYNAESLLRYFEQHKERLGFEMRVTVLGHVQRGGTPTVFDRLLATRLGAAANDQLAKGNTGVLVGLIKDTVVATPLGEVCGRVKKLDLSLIELAGMLAK